MKLLLLVLDHTRLCLHLPDTSQEETPLHFPNRGQVPSPNMNMMMQAQGSRPATNYLDMPIGNSAIPFLEGGNGASPTNAELEQAVHNLVRGADLSTLTKRGLRNQVEEMFRCDLSSRKADLNAMIDRALLANS